MIFPSFPGVLSFFQVFQVFQVEWEPYNLQSPSADEIRTRKYLLQCKGLFTQSESGSESEKDQRTSKYMKE